uniref:Uncharacterized protein n=1 Tax=Pelusios castaneus TaxID=367368 RepID=A0A8C8SE50_9SAUR
FGTLLAVQRLLQHQLQEFAVAMEAFEVQGEVVAGAEPVALHRVAAHVGVLRALDVEAGAGHGGLADVQPVVLTREAGRVVVDVQHLHLHVVHLDGLLDHQLQAQEAGGEKVAQRLPVHALLHQQRPAVQIQLQVREPVTRGQPGAPGRQPLRIHAQIARHVPHEGAALQLLLHRVAELPARRAQAQEEQESRDPERRHGRGRSEGGGSHAQLSPERCLASHPAAAAASHTQQRARATS